MGWDADTGLVTQGYDDLGRRTSLTRPSSTGTTYGYDNLGRLTSQFNNLAVTGSDVTWGFSYTPSGQLALLTSSSSSYVYNEPTNTTTAKSYDGLNRDAGIAGLSGGFDARGNLTTDGVRTFTYDIENRLLTKTATDGTANLTLAYDPEGRLSSYTAGTVTTQFLYDGTDLVGEYVGGAITSRYAHGSGADQPLIWFNGAGNTDVRYFYYDYHGSIIGYANSAGTLAQLYKYDAYGTPKSASNLDSWGSSGSRFRYTGQIQLPEAKLYYYKARVYDPSMGRFLQTDPIGSGDDLDLYAYTAGDPVNGDDPTGTQNGLPPTAAPPVEPPVEPVVRPQPFGETPAKPDDPLPPVDTQSGGDSDNLHDFFENLAEKLSGKPQQTYKNGQQTSHGSDSDAISRERACNPECSIVTRNQTITTATNGQFQSKLVPDVMTVYRDSSGNITEIHIDEVLSGSQKPGYKDDTYRKIFGGKISWGIDYSYQTKK